MKVSRTVLFGVLLVVPTALPAAAAEGCRFKGPVLFCLDGDQSLEAIVARFASDATAATLRAEAEDFSRFENRAARERYRVSVERNNARSVRYIKRADRELRRGRIDDAEYDRRLELYRAAYANYQLAYSRYEASYWFDPVEDADDGPDMDVVESEGVPPAETAAETGPEADATPEPGTGEELGTGAEPGSKAQPEDAIAVKG